MKSDKNTQNLIKILTDRLDLCNSLLNECLQTFNSTNSASIDLKIKLEKYLGKNINNGKSH